MQVEREVGTTQFEAVPALGRAVLRISSAVVGVEVDALDMGRVAGDME